MLKICKIIAIFSFAFISKVYAGAGFESKSYIIWIASGCAIGDTSCTNLIYRQTSKKDGKTITINGGIPIVGNLSGNLIGYKFESYVEGKKKSPITKIIHELSTDTRGKTMLYIKGYKLLEQEEVKQFNDERLYQEKIRKIQK